MNSFKNPPKHDLVIFDDESLSVFENFISHYDFFVLQVRIENINKIYCTFKIFKEDETLKLVLRV